MGHSQSAGGDTNNSVHKETEWKVKRRVKQQIKREVSGTKELI